jgi:hypothetical protein
MWTSCICNEIGGIGLLSIIPFNKCNELLKLMFYIENISFDKISHLQCQGSYKNVRCFSLKKNVLTFL